MFWSTCMTFWSRMDASAATCSLRGGRSRVESLGKHWPARLIFPIPLFRCVSDRGPSRDLAFISLSPESTLTPSPPQSATSAPGGRRLSELRARRLRLSGGVAEAGAGTAVKPTKDHTELGPIRRDPGLRNQGLQEAVRPKVPLLPKATQHMPHRPAPGPRAQVTDRRSFCAVEQRASTNHLVQTTREAGHHASSHSQGSSAENATASHTPAQQGELSLRLSHTLCV